MAAVYLGAADHALGDAVERAVVAFAHHRVDAAQLCAVRGAGVGRILDERVADKADVQRVGQGDGRFQLAEFLDLDQPHRFCRTR